MEHEVYVPFAVTAVRSAFADPARLARCVPGLRLGEGEREPGADGRLRVRVGPSTITYRGTLSLVERGEGFAVTGEGTQSRGSGTVSLRLTIVPRPVPDGSGTTLAFTGTVEASGRLAAFEPRQREAAARRLLDRFAAALAEDLERASGGQPMPPAQPPAAGGIGAPDDNERAIPGIPAPETAPEAVPETAPEAVPETVTGTGPETVPDTVPDTAPAADADPLAEEVAEAYASERPVEPEADFARRTMIGRSAEEVDHAPPRGRYAPEPPPGRTPAQAATLRWAAPVAALAAATAVLVTRRLLRRHR